MISGLSHLIHLSRAGFVFAREGVLALVDTRPLPLSARTLIAMGRLIERPSAKDGTGRLSAALTRLGPTYVKLGQFLATRPDVVGARVARGLESLQDRMPAFSQAAAEATIVAAFDKPLHAVFSSFGPPVAAASIAQVHRAEVMTENGPRAVAVKVLRPGIERRFRADLGSFYFAAHKGEAMQLRTRPTADPSWHDPLPTTRCESSFHLACVLLHTSGTCAVHRQNFSPEK